MVDQGERLAVEVTDYCVHLSHRHVDDWKQMKDDQPECLVSIVMRAELY